LKNKSLCSIIVFFIISLLISGCAARNSAQPVNYYSNQSQEQVQNTTLPAGSSGNLLKVHFIDVGQGDAVLVQTPTGQNMLIDAGENDQGDVVVNYLVSQGVQDLDVVIGTHPHSDHVGGLDIVINHFPVKNIYMPKVTQNTKTFLDVLTAVNNKRLQISTAQAGVVVPLDGVICRFIAPLQEYYEDLNNYSAVVKLEYGSQSFLFTGDAGTECETQILSSGVDLKSTVLKVGHHGSSTSSGAKFLNAVAPQYAVIMVGRDNTYGHPHAQTLTRLGKAGVTLYRTDQTGTIVFSTDGKDMDISKER